jgi:hypothetical protein
LGWWSLAAAITLVPRTEPSWISLSWQAPGGPRSRGAGRRDAAAAVTAAQLRVGFVPVDDVAVGSVFGDRLVASIW